MIPASRKVFEDIAEDGDLDLSYYNTPFEEDLDDLDYEDDQIIAEGYEDEELLDVDSFDDLIPTLSDETDDEDVVAGLDPETVKLIKAEVERLIPDPVVEQQPLPNIG